MTAPNSNDFPEPNTKSVDDFALRIYRRAYGSGPAFATVAAAVRGLKKSLGHLHAEAEDPDSVLNQPGFAAQQGRSAAFARQLTSLVEDSDLVLTQAETILKKYSDDDGNGVGPKGRRSDVELQERDGRIEVLQKEVTSQKIKIDMFLDTVQLHTPSKNQQVLENTDDGELDRIKDKVDVVASRLFRNKRSPIEGPQDDMWQEFKEELEKEGFSKDVLRQNKEVLRAYIRELESHQRSVNGSPPSVRGLLSHGPTPSMAPMSTPYPVSDGESPPNAGPGWHDRRPQASTAIPQLDPAVPRVLQPYHHSQVPAIDARSSTLSYEPSISGDSEDFGPSSDKTALISTRDLMAFDEADRMATRLGSVHLMPGLPPPNYSIAPGTSPSTRYLPTGAQPLMIPGSPGHANDMQLSTSPRTQQYGTSPRYVPPYPSGASPISSVMTPPPPYANSPPYSTAPSHPLAISAPPAGSDLVRQGSLPRQFSRLAPDSKGQEIPVEAKWTKIKRSLVSPEVLEKAGVRYEARPEFVAILGVLSREKIAEYAKLSSEVRNSRRSTARGGREKPAETYRDREMKRKGSISDDEDVLWDESDTSDDDRKSRGKHSRHSRDKHAPKGGAQEKEKEKEREKSDRHGDKRAIPVIVSPPASVNGDDPSPASTVGPKPILKNKNPNHVRFDGDGPREILPGDYTEKARRERDRSGHRGEREKDRGERDKDRPRDRDNRDRDKDRDRRRDRGDRDRDRDREHRSSHRDRDRESVRDRERGERGDRDRDDKKKSSTLKDSLGAAGIGGAAATLLSVLADAAVHL